MVGKTKNPISSVEDRVEITRKIEAYYRVPFDWNPKAHESCSPPLHREGVNEFVEVGVLTRG